MASPRSRAVLGNGVGLAPLGPIEGTSPALKYIWSKVLPDRGIGEVRIVTCSVTACSLHFLRNRMSFFFQGQDVNAVLSIPIFGKGTHTLFMGIVQASGQL